MNKLKPTQLENCPIVAAIRELGGEWNLIIIRYLLSKSMGFNELLKTARGISSKTLSSNLKMLTAKGIVIRKIVSTQPFSVSYSLTEKGRALEDIVTRLGEWGNKYANGYPVYSGNQAII